MSSVFDYDFDEIMKGLDDESVSGIVGGTVPGMFTGTPYQRNMFIGLIGDTSGSMYGKKLEILNASNTEIVNILKDKEANLETAGLKIAVMEFNSSAHWLNQEAIDIREYFYTSIENASGGTNYGAVYSILEKDLSPDRMLKNAHDYAPVILFVTDGMPNYTYEAQLEKLKKNPWFSHAIRIAIMINDNNCVENPEECKSVLREFTGSDEMVKEVKELSKLKDMIVTATVNSVLLQSRAGSQQEPEDPFDIVYKDDFMSKQ